MDVERDEPETIPAEEAPEPKEIFHFAQQMPEYPGGEQAMMTYLMSHMQYPQDCIDAEVEGKVYVGFVVDREGLVTDVEVRRGVSGCPAMNKEAVRVVRTMPKWTPGQQNGKPVPVQLTVPVMFKLN